MELERLLVAVARRWYVLLVLTALGAGLGLLADQGRSLVFEAEATLVSPSDRSVIGSETVLERLLVDELERVDAVDLKRAALTDADALDAIDPVIDMRAAQRPDSDVIDLKVRSTDHDLALVTANRWAETYLIAASDRKFHAPAENLERTRSDLSGAREALDSVNEEIALLLGDQQESSGGMVGSLQAVLLENPEIDGRQQIAAASVRELRSSLIAQQAAINTISTGELIGRAAGPLEATKSGNGLGPFHGALIGFGLALASVASLAPKRPSLRSARAMSSTVWPGRTGTRRPVDVVGTELLRAVSGDRPPLVAFTSIGRSFEPLQTRLAEHLAQQGFDVTVLNGEAAVADGVVRLSGQRLGEVVDIAGGDLQELDRSVVFADLADLWSRRALVEASSVVALVHIDQRTDTEVEIAREIAKARRITPKIVALVG